MEFFNDILNIMLPEFILVIFIMLQLILSIFLGKKHYKYSKWITLSAIISAIFLTLQIQIEPMYLGFKNSVISNFYTAFFKDLLLITSFLIVILTRKTISEVKEKAFQYNALILTTILSGLFLISANDFFVSFLAIEGIAFSTLFLIAFKDEEKSQKASLSHLLTNLAATAIYILGVYYIYLSTGSINFTEIYNNMADVPISLAYNVACFLIVSSLLLRLGIFPFNKWLLNIYYGTDISSLIFISTINIVSLFAFLARIIIFPLSYSYELFIFISFVAILASFWLNILAIKQTNVKKFLSTMACANCSYLLLGIGIVSVFNLSSMIFYVISYLFMNIGVFAGVVILNMSTKIDRLSDFKNFVYTNPIFTLCFSICLLGLAGFPITSGFISKMYIISALARSGLIFIPYLLLMLINFVLTAGCYMKIVRFMFEKKENPDSIVQHRTSSAIVILYTCSAITVILGFYPSKIIELCQYIAYNI